MYEAKASERASKKRTFDVHATFSLLTHFTFFHPTPTLSHRPAMPPTPSPLHLLPPLQLLLVLLLLHLPQPSPAAASPTTPPPGSRFSRRKPSDAAVDAYLQAIAAAAAGFNHERVGETRLLLADGGLCCFAGFVGFGRGWRKSKLVFVCGRVVV